MLTPDLILAEARRWIGTPYAHQASLIGVGCDCLGFVRGLYAALVGRCPPVPPYALLDAAERWLVRAGPEARPGDVLLFRYRAHLPAKHLAVAAGPDRMIHAYDGAAVAETVIGQWWRRRIAGVFAFPGVQR
jgi:NlpC/P60 family putative phage cell wall peptidase